MGKVSYIKCPRCELNYIPSSEEMCDVCKAELGLIKSLEIEEEVDYDEPVFYCSVCKRIPVEREDGICRSCAALLEMEKEDALVEDESWRKEYIDEEPVEEEPIEIPLEELQDEEYDAVYDDEEEVVDAYDDEDDFEEVEPDDVDFDDYDDEDDDDDYDDKEED